MFLRSGTFLLRYPSGPLGRPVALPDGGALRLRPWWRTCAQEVRRAL